MYVMCSVCQREFCWLCMTVCEVNHQHECKINQIRAERRLYGGKTEAEETEEMKYQEIVVFKHYSTCYAEH